MAALLRRPGHRREDFLEIGTDAVRVCSYQADVIPGLLQTEDYARAVIRAFDPEVDAETVEKRTELRMRRQRRVLEGDLRLWAVVDTGALERVVGVAARWPSTTSPGPSVSRTRPWWTGITWPSNTCVRPR
ncbi:MAG: hypothetical protein GEV28_09190 [Actinophytocola sp.]|nr:Scr1 family TA system antitoxin-like transcriptional regulator [Actinophytocola sp.]MPZ80549.1 hypothetical protein [Actinophytocola sp.]